MYYSEPGRRRRGSRGVAGGVHEAGGGDAAARPERGRAQARHAVRRDEEGERLLRLLDPRVDHRGTGGGGGRRRGEWAGAHDGSGDGGGRRGGRRGGRGGGDPPQDGVALFPRQGQLRVRHLLALE